MKDTSKRKLIRFLNGFDRISSRGTRAYDWSKTGVNRNEFAWRKQYDDDLDAMSGKDLSRELARQLLYTLPVALFLLFIAAVVVWLLVMSHIYN